MPKQTFFNLPDKKRQNLMKAAEEEFARVPLYKASIANIVKTAGIPRGSFYQYFEDKEDIYFYLLKEETKARKTDLIYKLKKYNGDIIEAVTELYYDFLVELPDEQELNLIKNALLNVTHKIENAFTAMFDGTHRSEFTKEIIKLIDKERLNIDSDKDIYHIFQIIIAVTFRNFVEKFSRELSDKEAIEHFTIEMKLLRQGLYKE